MGSSVSLADIDDQSSPDATSTTPSAQAGSSVPIDDLDTAAPSQQLTPNASYDPLASSARTSSDPITTAAQGRPRLGAAFADTYTPTAVQPQASASQAAGMPLADVTGKPTIPADATATPAIPRGRGDVSQSKGGYFPPTDIPIQGAKDLKAGYEGFEGLPVPITQIPAARGQMPRPASPKPQVTPEEQAILDQQANQRAASAAKMIQGAGEVGAVALPGALVAAPATTALSIGAGAVASHAAGAAVHGNVSPEAEELTRQVAFFIPSVAGTAAGLRTGARGTLDEGVAGADVFGGKAGVAVRSTPEAYQGAVKIGGTRVGVSVPRAAPPPEPSEAAKALMDFEQHTGNPDFQPPPPPPVDKGPQHLTPDIVKGVSDDIMAQPAEKRPDLMLEAHANMSKWMMGRGTFTGPDHKIYTVDSDNQAKRLASKFINDEVDRKDAEQEQAAKATEEAKQPTEVAPVSGKPPAGSGMTTDTAAVENVAQKAQLHPEQKPAVMVKEEPPKQAAALAKPPAPVQPQDVAPIGTKDKESDRTILQPSTDVMQNERLASQAAPELATKLSHIAAGVDGATFDRIRPQKELQRVDEKVDDAGKPPETVPDYLAAQIAADSPQAKDSLIQELQKNFKVVSVEDSFLEGRPKLAGYPSANVQVMMGNGLTAEVQIVPRDIQEWANESHKFYTAGREAELRGDHAEKDKQFAEATKLHNEAMDKFRERNGIEKPAQHEFASTQINVDPQSDLGQAHTEAVAKIPREHVGKEGIEKTPHVTIRYGLKNDSPAAIEKIKQAAAQIQPFDVPMGKTEVFPATKHSSFDHPVVARLKTTPELKALRDAVEGAGAFKEDNFPEYKPHVTLAYIKPEFAEQYKGGSQLEGHSVPVKEIVVSKRDGSQEVIPLGGQAGHSVPIDELEAQPKVKQAPIVQFRKDAARIEALLPPVSDRHTRLWRGNRPGEDSKPTTTAFTSDLPGIALPFRQGYGGKLTYLDVPTRDLDKYDNHPTGPMKGAEFNVPKEMAAKAKAAQHEEPTGHSVPLDELDKVERRTNPDERKRVEDMKPEERAHELLTSDKTGLPNYRAFHESDAADYPRVGYADLDDFKDANTELGHKGVDTVMLPRVGEIIRAAAAKEGVLPFHRSGDEFLFRAKDSDAIGRVIAEVNRQLAEETFKYLGKEKQGAGLSFGTGKDEVEAESKADEDKKLRKQSGLRKGIRDADSIKPGQSGEINPRNLTFDPKRFQYKMNVNEQGVTNLLADQKWNPDLAGVVTVWRNPADGKMYVINGHHRAQLALSRGVERLLVRHIDVKTASGARARGALQNIAEGRGTVVDAAKFFRETGMTPELLDKEGISLGERTAANGLSLAQLDPSIFEKVAIGKMSEGRGIAIGEATSDPAQQEAIVKLIDKREAQGKNITEAMVSELARFVGSSDSRTVEQGGLFGANQEIHSLAMEKAEISAYIKNQLSKERRVFGAVSSEEKAAALSRVKNQKIKASENRKISEEAGHAEEAYNRLSTRSGPVNDALDKAARELASGYSKPEEIKQRAYGAILEEVRKAVSGGDGSSAERLQAPAGPGSGHETTDDRQASVKPSAVEELRRAKTKPEEPALPGMDSHIVANKESAAATQGEELSRKLTEQPKSVSAKSGEMERNSPLFRDSEASGQSGLFNSEIKGKPGERGFARMDVPGVVLSAPFKAAKESVSDFIEKRKDANHYTTQARLLEEGLAGLDRKYEADVLDTRNMLRSVNKAFTPDEEATVYHAIEAGRDTGLSDKEKTLKNDFVKPIQTINKDLREELAGFGWGDLYPEGGYIHRIVEGKPGRLESAAKGQGGGKGNLLSKTTPSTKERRMFALEDADGFRMVVHKADGRLTGFDQGKPVDMGNYKALKPGGEFTSKDGQKWTLKNATTKEIEEATNLRYYKNAMAVTTLDNLELQRAVNAARFLESFKSRPDFDTVAIKADAGDQIPQGWKQSQIPQFRGYAFEPRTREVLDDLHDKMTNYEPPGYFEKIGDFLQTSILLNPLMHVANMADIWTNERGALRSAQVWKADNSFRAGMKALQAVTTRNEDYLSALRAGAPLMSHKLLVRDLNRAFQEVLSGEAAKDKGLAAKLRESMALPADSNPIEILRGASHTGAFMSNDIFLLQSVYDKMETTGMNFETALRQTMKTFPEYRVPTRVADQKWIADLMKNRMFTWFSGYHYGRWRAFRNMATDSVRSGASAEDRTWALSRIAMLGLLVAVVYPAYQQLVKKLSHDPNARVKRFGLSGTVQNMLDVHSGKKDIIPAFESEMTPSALVKGTVEGFVNRDSFTGDYVRNPNDSGATQVKQLAQHFTRNAVGPYAQYRRYKNDPDGLKKFLWSQVGVTFPKSETQTKAELLMNNIRREHYAPRTPEEQQEFEDKMQRIAEGHLTLDERRKKIQDLVKNEFQKGMGSFTYEQARQVYDVATPEERGMMSRLMLEKRFNTLRRSVGQPQ